MKSKKPKTTGRFKTREELEKAVIHDYYHTERNMTQIAKSYGISQPTVARIVDNEVK